MRIQTSHFPAKFSLWPCNPFIAVLSVPKEIAFGEAAGKLSSDSFRLGAAGNIKNFKPLFGALPLEGTAEILRAELARHVAAGMAPEEAVAKRLEELDQTTSVLIEASKTAIADNLPERVQRHVLAMLRRDIERRVMLTGEQPAEEVRAAHAALREAINADSPLFQAQAAENTELGAPQDLGAESPTFAPVFGGLGTGACAGSSRMPAFSRDVYSKRFPGVGGRRLRARKPRPGVRCRSRAPAPVC